jgi:hypothetical protein
MRILSTTEWLARADAHRARVVPYTMPWRDRRARKAVHPVYDFLFQYYPYSPGKLEAWHPDPGEHIADSPHARATFVGPHYIAAHGVIGRRAPTKGSDPLVGDRARMTETLQVLRDTQARPANFGCFGLHEWAMVYHGTEVRHQATAPLRLTQAEVDAFVESRPVACSHFDAFRFFAPAAKPLNRLPLAWEARYEHEQPGCIHANMDLYRWAYASMPWIGSDLLGDCFALAVALRELDMQAAPYDLRAFGVEPVRIETPEGREIYQTRQRALAARASVLRARLIDALSHLLD